MNLDPFEIYTDQQIWTALEHAHLKGNLKKLVSELAIQVFTKLAVLLQKKIIKIRKKIKNQYISLCA